MCVSPLFPLSNKQKTIVVYYENDNKCFPNYKTKIEVLIITAKFHLPFLRANINVPPNKSKWLEPNKNEKRRMRKQLHLTCKCNDKIAFLQHP